MIILGIDPGTAIVGYGVIKKTKVRDSRLKVVKYGCIKTKKDLTTPERLKKIYSELNKLIKRTKPDLLAIEDVFFFKNQKTAISVAQSRGVIILAAARANLLVLEYTPLQIKQAVSGFGRAEKIQVQKMVKTILKLKETPKPDDAADALACAICCAHSINYEITKKVRKVAILA